MLSSVGGVLGRAVTFRRQLVRKNGGLKNENLQNQLLISCSNVPFQVLVVVSMREDISHHKRSVRVHVQ
jgi:hypothetical protein